MANTTSNNNALEKFVSSFREARTILQDIEEEKKELTGRTERYEELRKKKIKNVFDYIKENNPNLYKDEDEMLAQAGEEIINAHYKNRAERKMSASSNILAKNLDGILSSINPENDQDKKKLENLLLNNETAPVIHASASEGYKEWLDYYNTYLSARALEEKAKKGSLDDKERTVLMQGYAAKVVENEMNGDKRNEEDKIVNKELLKEKYDLYYQMAIRSATKERIEEGAKKLVGDAEKALKEYEKKENKNVKGYVTSAIKKLASGNANDFALARELTYQLVEHKVK